jgi:hypothetical protein
MRCGQRTLQQLIEKLVRELLKDGFIETNAAFEIFERKIFVRRVCAAVR